MTRRYDGFAHGSTWNGFDNVAVTKATLDQIVADLESANATPDDLENFRKLEPIADGLYSLGWGFATQIVAESMGNEQEEFEKKLAAEQAAGFKDRMENSPPIGTGPDGKVVTYKSVDEIPEFKLQIVTTS